MSLTACSSFYESEYMMMDTPLVEIVSERRYGQPKLKKPKALTNVKQAMTYKYDRKTSFPVFVKNNDIYIKHRDWCSECLYSGRQYEEWLAKHHQKFIYNDTYGAVVLRGEAWIRIKGVLDAPKFSFIQRQLVQECEIDERSRFSADDARMIIDVCFKLWKEKRETA